MTLTAVCVLSYNHRIGLYESCTGALRSSVSSLCGAVEPSVEIVSGFTYVSVRVVGVMHIWGRG